MLFFRMCFGFFVLVLVYNLIMFMKEVSYGILMVSVDFTKDGCDSVSPSTNLRRFRFRPKRPGQVPPRRRDPRRRRRVWDQRRVGP